MIVIIILLMMPPSYLMMWGGDSVPGDPSLPPVRQSDINAWRQLEQATVFQNFTSENITVDPDINPDEVIHDIISNQNILELMTKYMEGSGDRDHTNSENNIDDIVKVLTANDENNLEITRQDSYLNTYRLNRHPIIGDGNCLFRAISYCLHGHQNEHLSLRELATRTLADNIPLFEDYFYSDNQNSNLNILDQINRLAQPHTFAGQECVMALARTLKMNILITIGGEVATSEVTTIEHFFDENAPRIHIAWTRNGGGHYESVMEYPAPNLATSAPSQNNNITNVYWNKDSKFTKTISLEPTNYLSSTQQSHMAPVSLNNHAYSTAINRSDFKLNKKQCELCKKSFKTNFSLKRHIEKQHDSNKKGNVQLPCMIPSCQFKFSKVKDVIEHAVNSHSANIETDHLFFGNEQEFKEFLQKEETVSNTRFILKRKPQENKKQDKTFQLVCHRDGYDKPHLKIGDSFQKKRKNKKGHCKINGLCPARLYVSIDKHHGHKVKYIRTHSHSLSFQQGVYMPIPTEVKDEIATMLSLKIPINNILDSVRQSFSSRENRKDLNNVRHHQFIDRKTIQNIKRKIVSSSVIQHSDDATSVFLRVQSLQKESFNPVILYKPQFISNQSSSLIQHDFMLVLMTEQQLSIYKKFADRILCMDSTHNTNQYKFKLITLLVPDEYRRGYPVAFCICNKEDETAITVFLQCIKNLAPETTVNTLMTDDDNAGWNAARSVYGENIKHYLCIWHIHKNWRNTIHATVKDKKTQTEIYSFLCAMLHAKTIEEFNNYREKFFSKYRNREPKFIDYFIKNYMNRINKWAICYRTSEYANVNTNMFIESFHNQLKTIYFEGKRNRRIDILLETLLQIENHIFIQHSKRKIYNIPADYDIDTMDRHIASLDIPNTSVTQITEIEYNVLSSRRTFQYTISIKNMECNEKHCYVKCKNPPCINLCTHMYTCSCPDFEAKNLCKHVHKVHSFVIKNNEAMVEDDADDELQFFTPECSKIEKKDFEKSNQHKLDEIKDMLKIISCQIEQPTVQKYRLNEIQSALRNIISANQGCELLEQTPVASFEKTEKFSSNANNVLQPRFKATSKTTGRKKKPLLKAPSDHEKKALLNDELQQTSKEPTEQMIPPLNTNLNELIMTEQELNNIQQNPTLYRIPPHVYGKPVKIKLKNGKVITVLFTKT